MKRKIFNFDIEEVVYKSENVAQCEVVGLDTENGYSVPVVHVIREEKYNGTDEALIQEIQVLCGEWLESDSIPIGYKTCTSFPVKANGKRDMEKLKQDREGFMIVKDGIAKNVQIT